MTNSLGALCADFYVNQKIALKMDLPSRRETVLDLFDRVRKELPAMDRFRRYDGELALESEEQESHYSWLALRRTSVRSGWVNPESLEDAYRLHRLILDIAPYFLSISPIEVDYVELVFGFDLEAETNRNEVVFDALFSDSPLAALVDSERESVLDAQPFLGISLNHGCDLQAFVEIKTRTSPGEVASGRYEAGPISVYLTARRYGPLRTIEDFGATFGTLAGHAERLAEQRVLPHIVMPIRETILSRPG
ncbi:MAG: hypothetical protein ACYTG1_03330 [Planctomycetota bacterium]|jgi:hypothetical protein